MVLLGLFVKTHGISSGRDRPLLLRYLLLLRSNLELPQDSDVGGLGVFNFKRRGSQRLARIAGVDLPRAKRIEIALTYIYGIGRSSSQKILLEAGIDFNLSSDDLVSEQIAAIRKILDEKFKVEGDLRREVSMNIKRFDGSGRLSRAPAQEGTSCQRAEDQYKCEDSKGPRRAVMGKRKK